MKYKYIFQVYDDNHNIWYDDYSTSDIMNVISYFNEFLSKYSKGVRLITKLDI